MGRGFCCGGGGPGGTDSLLSISSLYFPCTLSSVLEASPGKPSHPGQSLLTDPQRE